MNSLRFFQVILILVSVFIIILCSMCEDDPEPLIIFTDIPSAVVIGQTDTLKFRITSEEPLDSVELWEGSKNYARIGKDKMITGIQQDIHYILSFDLNFLYTPLKPVGVKSMELRVKSITHRKNTPFSVNVVD